jgi:exodeoxyribonuclease X
MNFAAWPRLLLMVDVEGNGAKPPDIEEIAAMPVREGRLAPQEAWATLIRPPRPITAAVSRIHHITNQSVDQALRWAVAGPTVHADLGTAWVAAHHASVDYGVIRRHLPTWQPAGVLDTLRLARCTYPSAPGYGLDALLKYTKVDLGAVPDHRHRAGYDAHAAALLLRHMARGFDTWQDLITVAVAPGMPGAPAGHAGDPKLW